MRPNSPPQIDERLVQESTLLKIRQESGRSPVDVAALLLKADVEGFLLRGAVRVPAPIEKLHVAHTAFDQPAGQQTIVGKMLLTRPGAIEVVYVLRFLREIDCVGGRHLHAERHFVLRDAGHGLRIAEFFVRPLVDAGDRLDHFPAEWPADALGIREEQHRIAVRTTLHALIDRRQESSAPQALAAAGEFAARKQHDKAGQILILASQSVGGPTADRRVTQVLVARVEQQLGRCMVELV